MIISIIIIICIIVIASNSGKSAKTIKNIESTKISNELFDYSSTFNKAELKEFQGKQDEAQDLYKESLFKCNAFISKIEAYNKGNLIKKSIDKDYKNREIIKSKISSH